MESIIAIGQHMHLDVVGEGVETESQRNILRGLGCTRCWNSGYSTQLAATAMAGSYTTG